MGDVREVGRLKEEGDVEGLLTLKGEVRGPVQLMQVNSALAEVWEEEEKWEEAVEAWRECIAISPANPELWEKLARTAMQAGRLSLSLSAYQSSYELSHSLATLLQLAQLRLRIHDYSNALVLTAFICHSQPWNQPAQQLHKKIEAIMQGKEVFRGGFICKKDDFMQVMQEKVVLKVGNLMGIAKALRRQLETGKDDVVLLFQRVPIKDPVDSAPPRVATKKGKNPLLQLHVLCEDIKKEVLEIAEPTALPLFGLNPMPVGGSWKGKCAGEREMERFFEEEWKVATAVKVLITTLCSNSPRPSPSLSDELGWEILHLYLVTDPPLPLTTELLTLFELSLKDTEHLSTLHKLHHSLSSLQSLFTADELHIRFKYAQAWFYYHIGEEKTKDNKGQVDALITAYALLQELEGIIGTNTYYFWWYGKILSQSSIQTFKDNIKDELMLIKVEDALKLNPKAGNVLMDLLSALCTLLKKRCVKDDPAFYWKKVKLIIKNLGKSVLTQEDQLTYSLCLADFMGILQYNLEDGSRLSKEIDLRFLLKTVCRSVYSKHPSLRKSYEAYCSLAAVNIIKYRPELFTELPLIVKKVMLSSDSLTNYFCRMHGLCGEYAGNDREFHFNLCKMYEKPVFLSGNMEAMNIIYAQLYGFTVMHKDCPCKVPKITPPETSFPKSVGKLHRMMCYIQHHSISQDLYGVYYPQTLDKDLSPALSRCYIRLPDLHLGCPLLKQAKVVVAQVIGEGVGRDLHASCGCKENARMVAEAFYQRYASDCFELALMKEMQGSFLSLLDTAEGITEKLMVVNPGNAQAWLLLGQIYLHKWMAGYYDNAVLMLRKEEYAKYADLCLRCLEVMQALDSRAEAYIYLVRGLIAFLQYRLDGTGLQQAEKWVSASLAHSSTSHSLETLMILSLIHLHMKSPTLPSLLTQLNLESQDKYHFLTLISLYKSTKNAQIWENYPKNREMYVCYVRSKLETEEFREEMMGNNGFYSLGKLFETKVMDRCIAFTRKKAKITSRYVDFYHISHDLSSLFSLSKELSIQPYPIYTPIFLNSLHKMTDLLGEISELAEVRLIYEFMEFVGSAEVEKEEKEKIAEKVNGLLGKYGEVFGVEQCEAQKPVKRRRKK